MDLTILGSSAAAPAADDACSGYLLTEGATRLLLDCGPGVVAQLQRHTALHDLAAVVITHFHADHCLDLVPLRYALRYGPGAGLRIPLWHPPGAAMLDALAAAVSTSSPFWEPHLPRFPYHAGSPLQIGGLTITPFPVSHDEGPAFALSVVGSDGRRIVYTGDAAPGPAVQTAAAGADLLLAESTYGGGLERTGRITHLTALEAGQVAAAAGVARLVLTHFWPHADRAVARAEAARAFTGEVLVARPSLTLTV